MGVVDLDEREAAQESACMIDPSPISKPIESTRQTTITLLPDGECWPSDLQIPDAEPVLKTRGQLGLPIDRPIIASGHQPIVFHPGIVAKLIALDHWSKVNGAHPVWIVPDQDVVDPASVRVLISNNNRTQSESSIRLGGHPNSDTPSSMVSPIDIENELPTEYEQLSEWIMGYTHEDTIARQFASATLGLLCDELDLIEPTILYASELLETSAGKSMLDQLLNNPVQAIESYNTQVDQFPDAGVRPLSLTNSQAQLPLWRTEQKSRRHAQIDVNDPVSFDRTSLLPTGLLMTAIMRSAVCDLFIHGRGGMEYDRITEHWMHDWLGIRLAPMVGASASVYLELDMDRDLPDPKRAAWEAHHARHNPSMLGDSAAAQRKQELVDQIEVARTQGNRAVASKLFAELHTLLDNVRNKHSDQIDRLDAQERASRELTQIHALAMDRTWPFPLYSWSQLRELKNQVIQALDAQQ